MLAWLLLLGTENKVGKSFAVAVTISATQTSFYNNTHFFGAIYELQIIQSNLHFVAVGDW